MSLTAITRSLSLVTNCPSSRNSSFVGMGPPMRRPLSFSRSKKWFFMASATLLKKSLARPSVIRWNLWLDCPPARIFPGTPEERDCRTLMSFPSRRPMVASCRSMARRP